MDIQILSRYKKNSSTFKLVSIRLKRLAALLEDTLTVYVVFVDDPEMKELNLRFKNKDKTTNVLSFQVDQLDPENSRFIIGEVIISAGTAKKEAKDAGIAFHKRLEMLFIHGFVHLLGYDHTKGKKQAALMKKKEDALRRLIERPYRAKLPQKPGKV